MSKHAISSQAFKDAQRSLLAQQEQERHRTAIKHSDWNTSDHLWLARQSLWRRAILRICAGTIGQVVRELLKDAIAREVLPVDTANELLAMANLRFGARPPSA